ncbi:hypothetical protein E3N88_27725 [Mikania micrantha]|uniref:Pentatricopeptide repeat-containing protein n=1 Tax=Mikania micrantha TaxID=192012 RepID=A0A5N6MZ13_9ASTR|nr:hypothetical protein E3N88_27725 [Mikania micrantha]
MNFTLIKIDLLNKWALKCLVRFCINAPEQDHFDMGRPLKAVELFSQMKVEQANEFVFASAISACASLLTVGVGKKVHALSVILGYADVSFVSNSLVSMYMKCGQSSDALSVFTSIPDRNIIAYNAMITGLVDNKHVMKAYDIFRLMCQKGLVPNQFSLAALIGNCTAPDDLWIGMNLHCQAVKLNLDSIAFVGNVLITMYSKFNLIEEAEKIFWSIEEKDMISWNTFIVVCCHALDHAKGLNAFSDMIKTSSLTPDDFTYTSALATCSGLASSVFGRQIHGNLIRTRLNYDTGVGNALVNIYSFEHDPVVLGCLLSACRVHGDLNVGKRTADRLLKIHKVSSSPYVLLSNLYASESMWEDVAEARKQLKDSLMKKEPGHSLIEVKGTVEKFTVGRISHSSIEEIVGVLQILSFVQDDFSWCH